MRGNGACGHLDSLFVEGQVARAADFKMPSSVNAAAMLLKTVNVRDSDRGFNLGAILDVAVVQLHFRTYLRCLELRTHRYSNIRAPSAWHPPHCSTPGECCRATNPNFLRTQFASSMSM